MRLLIGIRFQHRRDSPWKQLPVVLLALSNGTLMGLLGPKIHRLGLCARTVERIFFLVPSLFMGRQVLSKQLHSPVRVPMGPVDLLSLLKLPSQHPKPCPK